jgi:surface antigen
MIRGLLRSLSLAMLCALLAGPALAQVPAIDLRDEDIAMAKAAAAKLYENPATPVGATESWSNAKSGNSGTVTLVSSSEPNGVPCRRLQHVIKVKDRHDPFIFLFDRCLVDGEWKTYP